MSSAIRVTCLILILSWMGTSNSFALSPPSFHSQIHSLRGYAEIVWQRKNKTYRFDAVLLAQANPLSIHFEPMSDFGDTLFQIQFDQNRLLLVQGKSTRLKEGKFQKLLAIPMTASSFASHLLYALPDGAIFCVDVDEKAQRVILEKGNPKRRGHYKITFEDFRKVGNIRYPHRMRVGSKHTTFSISWKQIYVKK